MVSITEVFSPFIKGFSGFGSKMSMLFWLIVVGGLFLFVVWYFLEQKKYNKTVVLKRMMSNNQGAYFFDKAKLLKDKDGTLWWRLKKTRRSVEVPPDEAIEPSIMGNMIAFAAIDSNNQITWITADFNYEDYKKEGRITGKYVGINTESRANYAHQQEKNRRLRMGNSLKDNIPVIVGGITLVLLVAVVLLFLPKTLDKYNETQQTQIEIEKHQQQTNQEINEMLENINFMMSNMNEQQKLINDKSTQEVPN